MRPDGIFIAGVLGLGGDRVVKALRRRLGPRVTLIAPDAFGPVWALWDKTAGAAKGLYISYGGVPNDRLGPDGQRFVSAFRGSQPRGSVGVYAVAAAAATEVLIDAIARSDGTRASVAHQLLATRTHRGVLGPVAFDHNGDTLRPSVMVLHVERREGVSSVEEFEGGRVVAVEHPARR